MKTKTKKVETKTININAVPLELLKLRNEIRDIDMNIFFYDMDNDMKQEQHMEEYEDMKYKMSIMVENYKKQGGKKW